MGPQPDRSDGVGVDQSDRPLVLDGGPPILRTRVDVAAGYVRQLAAGESPVSRLVDAMAAAESARAAKKEPGGRGRLGDALRRVDELQGDADEQYQQVRERVGQQLALVEADLGPLTRPATSQPTVAVTFH